MLNFGKYKKEIISAFLGAAFAGVISLGVGMFSLTKSFEYTQNKEILYSIRKDAEFLKRVESEIDENINKLLEHDFTVVAKFGDPMNMIDVMENPAAKDGDKISQSQRKAMAMMIDSIVPILEFTAPRETLVVEAWSTGFPEVSNIDFELLQQINEYYRSVRRVNETVDRFMNLSKGATITQGFSDVVKAHILSHNKNLEELRKKSFVELKNKIVKEQERLSIMRAELIEKTEDI
ncbi:hypothetical protein E2H98_13025 [Permianibacter aggregans]|uniref:Uncharacterized protein n=2 Tax=Permianibacter aggregans TaxID=1510150 RepID=A0A4R6UQ01_9GAMM|nr:hypothetical protein [Permianibacter aggregans]QGX40541.1 hypothetical protein E2H98_13025 [Permianibacter aggregans]TDQ49310.1 hypothetical protein EV696_10414 [Permianibacter aggregans]